MQNLLIVIRQEIVMHLASSRARRVLVALVAIGSIMVAVSAQADAASLPPRAPQHTVKTKHTVRYKDSWLFKSHVVGSCIKFKVTGKIKYTLEAEGNVRGQVVFYFINQQLTDPDLQAWVYRYTRHGKCTSSSKLHELYMSEDWTGYACSFNPSLSVSIPWAVSLGGWPSCGKRDFADYVLPAPYGRGHHYNQANTGSPAGFSTYGPVAKGDRPCYGVTVTAVAWSNATTSDSFSSSNGKTAKKVCLYKA